MCVVFFILYKFLGYANIDRIVGFDLEGAKLVLNSLAQLHAVPIALKLKKPDVFQNQVKMNCVIYPFVMPESATSDDQTQKPPEWLPYIAKDKQTLPYYEDVCEALVKSTERDFLARPHVEPFASFSHCDMWVNNTMQLAKDRKLTKNKFVDFQMY